MKKSFLILLITTLISVLLSACGTATKNSTSQTNKNQEDSITFFDDMLGFSEGIAWVKKHDSRWMCIDTDGNELFSISGRPETNFVNGISIINIDDKRQVINKEGNIIFSEDEDNHISITSNKNLFSGYIFVKKEDINVNKTTTWVDGILDESGNWIFEPVNSETVNGNVFGRYRGFGIYECTTKGAELYGGKYFDIPSRKFLSEEEFKQCILEHLFDKSGVDLIYVPYGDGIVYYKVGYDTQTIQTDMIDNEKRGFFDRNHNLAIDLSKYSSVEVIGDFYNNSCPLKITNNQGDKFIGFINSSGDFLYEPKHVDDFGNVGNFASGLLKFGNAFIDNTGNAVISSDKIEETKSKAKNGDWHSVFHYDHLSGFNEYGLAVLGDTNDGSACFINTSGDIAF